MISFRTAKWLLLGGVAVYAYSHLRSASRQRTGAAASARPAARRVPPGPVPDAGVAFEDLQADPNDVVQGLDDDAELRVDPLTSDAYSAADIEAAADLAALETDLDGPLGLDSAGSGADANPRDRDVGELYGLHTPRAVDTDIPDNDRSFDQGQNWLEALETSAVENGATPEQELSLMDEQDEDAHVVSERADRPIADLGSAGPRGV